MFERFTDRARRCMMAAQEEAKALKHNYIGTEHLVLGLFAEHEGVGAKVLTTLYGISLTDVRDDVLAIIGPGKTPPAGHIPFTPRAKGVLELSLREALKLGHNYIGTEHILLGILREAEGVGAKVLMKRGVTHEAARDRIVRALTGLGELQVAQAVGQTGTVTAKLAEHLRAEGGPACPGCRAPLEGLAAWRILEVPEQDGDGKAKVLFVFCRSCGRTIDTLIAPDES